VRSIPCCIRFTISAGIMSANVDHQADWGSWPLASPDLPVRASAGRAQADRRALLLTAVVGAIYEKLRWGTCDDAIWTSRCSPRHRERMRRAARPDLQRRAAATGDRELMLCVIASRLAIYGRGYLVQNDLVRPAFSYVHAD